MNQKPSRQTVQMVPVQHNEKLKYRLQGTESADENRANVFGVWEDFSDGEYEGHYIPARPHDEIGVEIEVRFAFCEGDADDHAEVYAFQVWNWARKGRKLICSKDEHGSGEWVAESGDIYGPHAIYAELIYAAANRIRDARWNKTPFETRTIGPKKTD